jgi:hypothetical protein
MATLQSQARDSGFLQFCPVRQYRALHHRIHYRTYDTALSGGIMKNALFATIALAVICTAGAVAQDQHQGQHDQQATSHRAKKTTVRGYVRKDGDNYVVEDDRDKTRYRVQNTEAIREHEGHHVQVNARLHEDDHSLEVNKVKRLKDDDHHDH